MPARISAQTLIPAASLTGGFQIAVYCALLIGLFYPSYDIMFSWWKGDDYAYCWAIPFIIAYIIWEKRSRLLTAPSAPSWKGSIFIAAGVVLYWLGEFGGEYYTLYLSSWSIMVGLCWLHFGWPKIRAVGFTFVLMLTAFPLPRFIYNNLSVQLQLISSQIGVFLMRLWGLSAYRDGNVIDLGTTQLQVVDACNGLRYLLPLVVLGLVLAYFFKASFWKRTVLLISAVPLAIVVNGLRIASMGIALDRYHFDLTKGFSHDFSGWGIFMLSLAILLGEMWVLKRICAAPSPERTNSAIPKTSAGAGCDNVSTDTPPSASGLIPDNGFNESGPDSPANALSGKLFKHSKFIAATLVLAITLAFVSVGDFREKAPAKKPFSLFPPQIGEWRGARLSIDAETLDSLHLSDYTILEYRRNDGKKVGLYIGYYESQRKGQSIHSPATCLPGTGWVFEQSGTLDLELPNHKQGPFTISRAFITKQGSKQLVYYWFPQRGRILTSLYQIKFYNFWDNLVSHRSDGALVRLITQVSDTERVDDADKRMREFVNGILPFLEEFIPGQHLD